MKHQTSDIRRQIWSSCHSKDPDHRHPEDPDHRHPEDRGDEGPLIRPLRDPHDKWAGKVPIVFLVLALSLCHSIFARAQEATFNLRADGTITTWLVAGPFDQGIEGFGDASDLDVIGESSIQPVAGDQEQTELVSGGMTGWTPISVSDDGYLDLMAAIAWQFPSNEPEKLWQAKAAYAVTYLDAPRAMSVTLRTGSNSGLKVMLNGDTIYRVAGSRNAVVDTDSMQLNLIEGRNTLLLKVTHTHLNASPDFFGTLEWQWGAFVRITDDSGSVPEGLTVVVPVSTSNLAFSLESTFFFKGTPDSVLQRFDLVIDSPFGDARAGEAKIRIGDTTELRKLGSVPFGTTRHPIWLPAVTDSVRVSVGLTLGATAQVSHDWLLPKKRYEIYLAMMSHTDIGYTNIQPVVKERHLRTLDSVIERCEVDSTFKWTIETVWQLEQYELDRPQEQFQKLIALIKEGRIAVSPVYSNPYTGWVSNEEFYRGLDLIQKYRERFGFTTKSAIYNDVPGLSWLVPQALNSEGVSFLATGINEVYGGYTLQQALPKAFYWEGPGGGQLLTYRNEAYNEAQLLGLAKGKTAVENKLWERLHRLQAQGYTPDLLLAVHTFGDNGPIPLFVPNNASEWNKEYLWPRFVVSTIDDFRQAFESRYGDDLPTLSGDWTSSWDVLYQGEAPRMVRLRWTQNNLPSAEKAATIAWLVDESQDPFTDHVDAAYRKMLHFTGHGSGLEYGYASPRDNITAMDYREDYVESARLDAVEVMERALFKLATPEETFEGEGLFLFNPLNWSRKAAVEFEFVRESSHTYHAVDIETGKPLPSHFSGYTLRLVTPEIPELGYLKIRLVRGETPGSNPSDLRVVDCNIENEYYRIEADCESGIRQVVDKKTGKVLTDRWIAEPVRADSLYSLNFESADSVATPLEVIDQRPARLAIRFRRSDGVFGDSEIGLWSGLDYIDVRQDIALDQLPDTDTVADYSSAFKFKLGNVETLVDAAGGFLNPDRDRFPGIEHDAYAVRRGVSLSNQKSSVDWISLDSRVVRIRQSAEGDPIVYANLTNNFPEAWNRWEDKFGSLTFRFAVRGREGGFDPEKASRFGWDMTVPVVGRYTWLRSETPQKSYLAVDGDNVILLSMRKVDTSLELRLMNTDTHSATEAVISSDLQGFKRYMDHDMSASITVPLSPGEIKTVRLPARVR